MGIKYTAASSEYLQISSNLIGSDVFTWAVWFYLESQTGADQDLLWSGETASSDVYHRLQYDDSANEFRFSFRNGATNHAITTNGATVGGWNHLLAYRASATDARVYLDNAGEGTNTTSVTGVDALTDSFAVGMSRDDTPTDPNDGVLAEIAIWNVAITDAALRQALANGVSPELILPGNLIRHFRCVNLADLNDRMSSTTLTAFNTPISGRHPAISMPSKQLILPLPTAATSIDKSSLNTGYSHFGDIVFAAGFDEKSGNFKELVTDTLIGVLEVGASRSTDPTYGRILTCGFDVADGVNFGDNAAWDGLSACTVLALAKNNKSVIVATGPESVVSKWGTGDDALRLIWSVNGDFDTNVGIGASSPNDFITDGLSPGETPADQWNLIGFTWDGSTLTARINTIKGPGTAAVGTMNATAHDLFVGNRFTADDQSWDGEIALAVIMDVALNDTDWNSLVTDPLQIFVAGPAPVQPMYRRRCIGFYYG